MNSSGFGAAVLAALLFLCPASRGLAGEITVTNPIDVIVPDDSGPDDFAMTAFPDVPLGSSYVVGFSIINTGSTTRHITGPITAGASSGISVSYQPPLTTLAPGDGTYFFVNFTPQFIGLDSSTIAIPTDADGSESSYAFTITGRGVNDFSDLPDLGISAAVKKVKRDKKTGYLDVSGKMMVSNAGTLGLNSAEVDVYFSPTRYFRKNLPLLGTVFINNLPVPGKKGPKIRKKSFKFSTGSAQPGFIYMTVTPLDPAVKDQYYLSNLATVIYLAPN